jgi:hypothetical protein
MRASMTDSSFREKFKLVKKWGYLCVVCGRAFLNLACVTSEHIIPKSVIKNKNRHSNMGPSHWRCNIIKENKSLIATARLIDAKERQMCPNEFETWLNVKVPARRVPWYALEPIIDAEWFIL